MPQFKTLMDILKLLEKSNCRKCNEKTCMAFAAAVFKGDQPISDSPQIASEIAQMYGNQPNKQINNELDIEQQLAGLRGKLMKINFADAAKRIGSTYDGARLVLKIMGKDFRVDTAGDIFNGQSVGNHYQSDVALVLHPLPLVPLLICFWRAEEGMTSNLNLFFDASAEDNLGIYGIYALGTGITRMYEKLALRHGSMPG